jgi:Rieske Fe-S protein
VSLVDLPDRPASPLSRRELLRGAAGVAGVAALAAVSAACGDDSLVATPTPGIITRWVRIPTADLQVDVPEWVDFGGTVAELVPGAETPPPSFTPDRNAGWVVRQPDGTVLVLDPRCTHRACLVDVSEKAPAEFLCRCHPGRFSFDGAVLGGPPPRPLSRYPTRPAGPDAIEVGLA